MAAGFVAVSTDGLVLQAAKEWDEDTDAPFLQLQLGLVDQLADSSARCALETGFELRPEEELVGISFGPAPSVALLSTDTRVVVLTLPSDVADQVAQLVSDYQGDDDAPPVEVDEVVQAWPPKAAEALPAWAESARVQKAVWYPYSNRHIAVLTAFGFCFVDVLRLTEAPTAFWFDRDAVDTTGRDRSRAVADIAFGSARGWEQLTVFVATVGGDVYSICPAAPPGVALSSAESDQLVHLAAEYAEDCRTESQSQRTRDGFRASERRVRDGALLYGRAEAWLQGRFRRLAGAHMDGHIARQLVREPAAGVHPLWSPDEASNVGSASGTPIAPSMVHCLDRSQAGAGVRSATARGSETEVLCAVPSAASVLTALCVARRDGSIRGLVGVLPCLPHWSVPTDGYGVSGGCGLTVVKHPALAHAQPQQHRVSFGQPSGWEALDRSTHDQRPGGAKGVASVFVCVSASPPFAEVDRFQAITRLERLQFRDAESWLPEGMPGFRVTLEPTPFEPSCLLLNTGLTLRAVPLRWLSPVADAVAAFQEAQAAGQPAGDASQRLAQALVESGAGEGAVAAAGGRGASGAAAAALEEQALQAAGEPVCSVWQRPGVVITSAVGVPVATAGHCVATAVVDQRDADLGLAVSVEPLVVEGASFSASLWDLVAANAETGGEGSRTDVPEGQKREEGDDDESDDGTGGDEDVQVQALPTAAHRAELQRSTDDEIEIAFNKALRHLNAAASGCVRVEDVAKVVVEVARGVVKPLQRKQALIEHCAGRIRPLVLPVHKAAASLQVAFDSLTDQMAEWAEQAEERLARGDELAHRMAATLLRAAEAQSNLSPAELAWRLELQQQVGEIESLAAEMDKAEAQVARAKRLRKQAELASKAAAATPARQRAEQAASAAMQSPSGFSGAASTGLRTPSRRAATAPSPSARLTPHSARRRGVLGRAAAGRRTPGRRSAARLSTAARLAGHEGGLTPSSTARTPSRAAPAVSPASALRPGASHGLSEEQIDRARLLLERLQATQELLAGCDAHVEAATEELEVLSSRG